MNKKKQIRFIDFLIVYIRSFLYQNLLNEKYMQNFGFLYVMYPVFKKFSKNKEDIKNKLLDHFEYFNTNPYLVSFIFGVAMRLFEDGTEDKLKKFKFETMTSFAGIGDALSWGIMRSYLTLIAFGMVLFNKLWGVLIFLIFYNLVLNVFFRFFGIVWGYKSGQRVIFKIAELDIQKVIYILKQSGLFILGVMYFILLKFKYNIISKVFMPDLTQIIGISTFFIILFLFYHMNKKFVPIVVFLIYFLVIAFLYIKF